ncbi:tyrosine-type recombinase/integrase [Jiangella gansuensis]|uniref:tyrosine-type recombinase/integrase n=1 Tax=Jiangella gansuensis TaxID=281473 RepID=UPI0004B0D508|nr:tyrosine-type recombinase/integrase [Jiangella gansuensis]
MHARRRIDAWADCINAYSRALAAAGFKPETTIRKRRYQIRRFCEYHLHRMPGKVSRDDIVSWLASWKWSAESLKSEIAALRGFYRWMVETKRCKSDPTIGLKTPSVPRGVPTPTPEPVFEDALAAADHKTALVLLSGAEGGARAAETARQRWDDMTWSQVILDDGTMRTIPVRIRLHGKGGKTRVLPVKRRWALALADEYERRQAGATGTGWRYGGARKDDLLEWVFPGRTSGHVSPGFVGDIAKRAIGMKGHTLRHRFATRALRTSGNLRAVQRLLGHASVATTQIYTLVDDDELTAVVDAI